MICVDIESSPTLFRNKDSKSLWKLEGSIGDDLCFRRDILRVRALTNGDIVKNCDGNWCKKDGIISRACNAKFI